MPVARKTDSLEQVADELYGLPPGEFTEARDALVKRLRADKERDLANQVKGLRRPTVAAWALNQLVRNRRKDVGALRIRLVAVKNNDCADFPLKKDDGQYADGVLLELDAWVLLPR